MKRQRSMILALMLLACLALPAAAEPLFSANGLTVELLNYQIYKTSGANATMQLNARVINDSDQTLSLWVDDATVNGVPVTVAGLMLVRPHSDTGEDDPKYFYVMTSGEGSQAASAAIANAVTLEGTLRLMASETKETLCTQPMSVELARLDGLRNVATPTPMPTPAPTAMPDVDFGHDSADSASYAPVYIPESYHFKTLTRGAKGQAVRDLQQRLTDLGFLNDRVDGSFGQNTMTAVRSFCDQHGLPICNEATPEMQQLLYSSSARYYREPYIPLVIGQTFNCVKVKGLDMGSFTVQLTNRSRRDIRGYVLYFYLTDVWGENRRFAGGKTEFGYQGVSFIKSGYTEDSFACQVEPYANTYAVYVGVQKIVFDDGEIREIDPADVVYYECVLNH